MTDRPDEDIEWAESATSNELDEPSTKRSEGWDNGDTLPAEQLNYHWRSIGRWLRYAGTGPGAAFEDIRDVFDDQYYDTGDTLQLVPGDPSKEKLDILEEASVAESPQPSITANGRHVVTFVPSDGEAVILDAGDLSTEDTVTGFPGTADSDHTYLASNANFWAIAYRDSDNDEVVLAVFDFDATDWSDAVWTQTGGGSDDRPGAFAMTPGGVFFVIWVSGASSDATIEVVELDHTDNTATSQGSQSLWPLENVELDAGNRRVAVTGTYWDGSDQTQRVTLYQVESGLSLEEEWEHDAPSPESGGTGDFAHVALAENSVFWAAPQSSGGDLFRLPYYLSAGSLSGQVEQTGDGDWFDPGPLVYMPGYLVVQYPGDGFSLLDADTLLEKTHSEVLYDFDVDSLKTDGQYLYASGPASTTREIIKAYVGGPPRVWKVQDPGDPYRLFANRVTPCEL